jgi:hypothetical protein
MNKITLSFQYDQKEYINAFRKYLFQSKIIRKRDLIIVAIMSIVEVLLFVWSGLSIYSIVLGIILCFYLLIFSLLYYYQPGNVYKRTPKLHLAYKMTFTPERIMFKTSGVASELKWNIYKRLWQNQDFYYLIQTKNIYTIIPKRAFRNKEEMKLFESMAASSIISAITGSN